LLFYGKGSNYESQGITFEDGGGRVNTRKSIYKEMDISKSDK